MFYAKATLTYLVNAFKYAFSLPDGPQCVARKRGVNCQVVTAHVTQALATGVFKNTIKEIEFTYSFFCPFHFCCVIICGANGRQMSKDRTRNVGYVGTSQAPVQCNYVV